MQTKTADKALPPTFPGRGLFVLPLRLIFLLPSGMLLGYLLCFRMGSFSIPRRKADTVRLSGFASGSSYCPVLSAVPSVRLSRFGQRHNRSLPFSQPQDTVPASRCTMRNGRLFILPAASCHTRITSSASAVSPVSRRLCATAVIRASCRFSG